MSTEVAATPEQVGVSGAGLARIDRHLARYVDAGRLPGGVVLIARHGQIAHLRTFGSAVVERSRPVEFDTIYRIYSMTKPITAVAIMQLHERGLVQLDDAVHRYLESWQTLQVYRSGEYPDFDTVAPDRAMTVRDLLTHQSGLAYGLFEDSPVDRAYQQVDPMSPGGDLEEMILKLSRLPLRFSPGRRWNYSVAFDVLGHLVEQISGQAFDEYLAENILEPLGMIDTGFWVPPERIDRLAANYRATAEGGLVMADDPVSTDFRHRPSLLSGGGGLTSTAGDFARFAQALCNGGALDGQRILGRKTIELMTANHLAGGSDLASVAYGKWSETSYSGIGYGLGVAVTLDPAVTQLAGTAGEFHWGGMASTMFLVDPAEQLVLVFLTQLMPSSTYNLRRELRGLVYGALL